MKTAFSTLGCTDKNLDEILALAVQYGMDGLEFRGIGGILDTAKIADFAPGARAQTRSRIAAAGKAAVVVGTSCAFHDPARTEAAIAEGVNAVAVAEGIGAPFIRVFGNKIKEDFSATAQRVSDGIAQILHRTADRPDVSVLLEVHGDFNSVERLDPVVQALADEPRFGLIWDVKHTDIGYRENWGEFYTHFRPLIRHVHLKDALRATETHVLPGDGDLPLRAIISRLASDGYDGFFSLEWERKWHPELPPIEEALEKYAALFR